MSNSVDLDQTSPIGAVCSESTLFASILKFIINVWHLFAADDFSRRHFQIRFFLGTLRVKISNYCIQRKEESKNQEWIQSSTTPDGGDTTWESDRNTWKHHTQEIQEVSPFPAGDHKAARNRQDSITKTNTKHK